MATLYVIIIPRASTSQFKWLMVMIETVWLTIDTVFFIYLLFLFVMVVIEILNDTFFKFFCNKYAGHSLFLHTISFIILIQYIYYIWYIVFARIIIQKYRCKVEILLNNKFYINTWVIRDGFEKKPDDGTQSLVTGKSHIIRDVCGHPSIPITIPCVLINL